jgi:hypothetical protein
LCVPNV